VTVYVCWDKGGENDPGGCAMMARGIGDCTQCDRRAFLRPVIIFSGMAGPDCAVTVDLCLWCRVGWRDSRWCDLVETWFHHRNREARETAQWAFEWRDRKSFEVAP
jgi:hypothetical protein